MCTRTLTLVVKLCCKIILGIRRVQYNVYLITRMFFSHFNELYMRYHVKKTINRWVWRTYKLLSLRKIGCFREIQDELWRWVLVLRSHMTDYYASSSYSGVLIVKGWRMSQGMGYKEIVSGGRNITRMWRYLGTPKVQWNVITLFIMSQYKVWIEINRFVPCFLFSMTERSSF